MKPINILATSALIFVTLASCSKDDDSSSSAINPSYSVYVNGVKIVSADMQNSSPEAKEVEVTQYDNISFCNSSINVAATKWLVSSEKNTIESEEDTLRMQFLNVDDVYNNINLSLTGVSAGQKMDLSVPVTFNVKSFEYPGSGGGENPSVTDEPYDILGEGSTTSMTVSDDAPDIIKIDLGGDLDFKLMPYSTKGFTVTSTPSAGTFASRSGSGSALELTEVYRSPEDGSVLELKLAQAVPAGVNIAVAYDGAGDIMFINGRKLAAFDTAEHPDMDVDNEVEGFTHAKLSFVIENDEPNTLVVAFKEENTSYTFADEITSEGLSVKVNGIEVTINSLIVSDDNKSFKVVLSETVESDDNITVSYDGAGTIALNNGSKLESFENVGTDNNVKNPTIEIKRDMISFFKNKSVTAISIKPGLTEDNFKTPTNLINSFELYANGSRVNISSVNITNNNINVILPVAITANDIIKLKFNGKGLETTNGFAVSPFEFDELIYTKAENTSAFDPFMHSFERYLQNPDEFQVSNFAILGWSVATNVGKETNSPVKYENQTEGNNKNMVLVIDNEGNISSKGQIYFMPKTDGGHVVSFPEAGKYKLEFRYKAEISGAARCVFQYTETAGLNFTKAVEVSLSNKSEWTDYMSEEFTFKNDLSNYKFNFAKNAIPDGAKIYIDDIRLIPVK